MRSGVGTQSWLLLTSAIRQQRRHQPAVVMGDSGLLQEFPGITALLPEAGGDGEQPAAADRSLARLDAPAVAWQTSDPALNHRLTQGTLGSVVGWLDSLRLQEGPQAIRQLEDLAAGAHRFGPRRSLVPLDTQLHHSLQRRLKVLADRPAAVLQTGPVDRSILVAVPVAKQLPLQLQQLGSELGAGTGPFRNGPQVPHCQESCPLGLTCPPGGPTDDHATAL
jgi:hypothetical protein